MAQVIIEYVLDRRTFDQQLAGVEAANKAAVNNMAADTGAAAKRAQAPVVQLTAAEEKLAAEIRASEAALKAKAQALGLTITQTRKLERELAASAKSVQTFESSTGNARAAAQNLQAQLFDIGSQLSTGTNPLIILSQQGPQVAQALSGAESATAALRGALASLLTVVAPAAAAIGTVYVAWRIYSEDATRAKETTALVQSALDAIRPSIDATRDATVRLRVATGELTDEQGQILMAATGAWRSYQTATEETRAKVAELTAEQGGLKTQIVDSVGAFLDVVDVAGVNSRIFDALTTDSEELGGQIDALRGAQDAQIDALRSQVEVTSEAIRAENQRKTATKAMSEAAKEAAAAQKELEQSTRKATEALIDQLAQLLALTVEAERAADFWRDYADATASAATPQTISRLRDLQAQVDEVVQPAALSRVDQLRLLLLDLELEASRGAHQADALAENIAAVGRAIEDAEAAEKTQRIAEGMERARAAAEGFGQAIAVAGDALSIVGGLLSTLTGGALSGVASPSGAIEAAGTEGSGMVTAAVEAAVAFVEQVVAQLPAVLDALADGVPVVIRAVTEALPQVVQSVIDALPALVDGLIETVPRLLIELATQAPLLVAAVVKQLPALVEGLLGAIPSVIRGLVDGLPVLFDAIFAAVPDIVLAVVEALPDIIQALAEALPQIALSLVDSIVTELLPRLPEIALALAGAILQIIPRVVVGLMDGIREALPDLFESIGEFVREAFSGLGAAGLDFAKNLIAGIKQFFADLIREITSLGTKKTETFGDTPGPVRVAAGGLTARFAAGDVVVAARTPEGVRRQLPPERRPAGQPTGAGSMARPVLDLSEGHVAFDGLFRRNIKAGALADLTPARGRRNPYA